MPPNRLIYGLDDRPPLQVLLLSGLQHVAVITVIGMVFPLLVADRAGADPATRQAILGVSMLALGLGTLLQCLRLGPVGSGYLAPVVFTAAYMPASLKAAEQGGMPLVLGMTIFAGLCGVLLSQVVGCGRICRRRSPVWPCWSSASSSGPSGSGWCSGTRPADPARRRRSRARPSAWWC